MTVRDTEIPQAHLWPDLATTWLEATRRHDPPGDTVAKAEFSDRRADPAEPPWPRVFPGL